MRLGRLTLLLGATGVLALVLGACGGAAADRGEGAATPGSASTSDVAPPTAPTPTATPGTIAGRPVPVARSSRTDVDTSRPTPAGSQTPERPGRTLVSEVYVPQVDGPRPLIVFSHGLMGHPDKFTRLLDAWARAGYVVVAPAFPLTNDEVPGAVANARDLWQQPADVSFVIDRVLAANQDPTDPLFGRIDPERIGAGGLSLGGATTFGLVFNDCCRDRRIRAAEVLSGNPIPLPQPYRFDSGIPVLIMHGDADASLPLAREREVYDEVTGPKMFVTLLGGTHAPPFEDPVTPYDELVERTTVAFWDLTVGGDPGARRRLAEVAAVDGLTRVDDGLG
ncbi:MAG: dienelactone hydrolase family protein [Acidimicrobiales bacterium]